MKVTINGVVFENPERFDITVEIDGDEETMGPIRVDIPSGCLRVVATTDEPCMTINGANPYSGETYLIFDTGILSPERIRNGKYFPLEQGIPVR